MGNSAGKFMGSGGGGMLGWEFGTSVRYVLGSIIGSNKGSVESNLFGIVIGDIYGMKYGTIRGPDDKVLGTTIGAAHRSKLGENEVSWMVSPDGSFDASNYGNLEGLIIKEGDLLGFSEGTGYVTILVKTDSIVHF